jgi:hypothetical protein
MSEAKQSFYDTGTEMADKLETENGAKANIVQKAYEAAVEELGYSNKELMDSGKAKIVAKLMFSDKYLGNAEFNPLLKDKMYSGFDDKEHADKQRLFQHMLGMNIDNFVGTGGIIDKYGGLQRLALTQTVERQYDNQTAQQLTSMAWNNVYDPKKSLTENMDAYANEIQKDPILAHTGAKLDPGKFDSVDDIANALATSLVGQSNKEGFKYRHGVDFGPN